MSNWEKNITVLKNQYPGLLESVSSDDDDFPHVIETDNTPTGDVSLRINGVHVHSPRDPVREGDRLAQTAEKGEAPLVILGFGLGYVAQSAVKLGRPVIIVEKNRKILRLALELRDLTGLLKTKNIIFVVGGTGDGILNALNVVTDLNNGERLEPVVIRNKALFDLDIDWYKSIEDKIRSYSMKDKVNTATQRRFAKRWVRNISRNMGAIRDYPGVSRLAGLAAGTKGSIPVLLAAAGPSLDKIKPILNGIYERCIIVAVDTSLRFFVQNGIQPDFVVTVDPQFWNSRHLDRCVCEKTALIAESAAYPPVLNLPFKRKFLCGSLFALGSFIEMQVDPKGRLGAGGSVATTAWDFARTLSPSGIWIAGLDLAFPELKTHFRGARFEERANYESSRFNPLEKWVVRALRDGFPFKAKSGNGSQVLTDRRLSLYAAWFENQFKEHKNTRSILLSRDGLAIEGLQAESDCGAEQLLALPSLRVEINSRLHEFYAQIDAEFNSAQEKQKRSEKYEEATGSLARSLKSIKKTAQEGLALAEAGRVKELDTITRRIAQSDVKEIASFLLPTDYLEEKGNDYLLSSVKLFNALLESVDFYLNLMPD